MALDKLVDSTQLDNNLTSVANAIRAKSGGTGQLAFPAGFVSEIGNISGGGGITPTGTKEITITSNGTTTEDVTNYANAQITVNVPSSGGGVFYGDFTPSANTNSVTIDALSGKSFTHFLCKMEGTFLPHLSGNTVRTMCACYLDLTPNAMNGFAVGTNASGTALSGISSYDTPTTNGAAYLNGNVLNTSASASGGGVLLHDVKYEWFAW